MGVTTSLTPENAVDYTYLMGLPNDKLYAMVSERVVYALYQEAERDLKDYYRSCRIEGIPAYNMNYPKYQQDREWKDAWVRKAIIHKLLS